MRSMSRPWPDEALTSELQRSRRQRGPTNISAPEDTDGSSFTISWRLRRAGVGCHIDHLADAGPGRGRAQCRGGPERLGDASRYLQVLPLQRPRSDQCRQRQESRSRVDAFSGARHPRSAVDAARPRRRAVLFRLLQPCLRAGRSDRQDDLELYPGARRGTGRQADALAIQPRPRTRTGQSLCRHGRRAPDRAQPEDRQAGV